MIRKKNFLTFATQKLTINDLNAKIDILVRTESTVEEDKVSLKKRSYKFMQNIINF